MDGWRKYLFSMVDNTRELKTKPYSCRFIGECHLSFLKSEDCHLFALHCANTYEAKHFKKGSITLTQDDITMSFEKTVTELKRHNSSESLKKRSTFRDSVRSRPISPEIKLNELNSPALKRAYTIHGQPIWQNNWNFRSEPKNNLNLIETIPIEKVAYCGVVPFNPRYFFIASRGRYQGLKCRVFVFSRAKMSQKIERDLSLRFDRFYRDWQSKFF